MNNAELFRIFKEMGSIRDGNIILEVHYLGDSEMIYDAIMKHLEPIPAPHPQKENRK